MNFAILSRICRMYARLGWAVMEQMEAVFDGADFDDQNPNALEMIENEFLRPLERIAEKELKDDDFRSDIIQLRNEIREYLEEKAA